MKTALFSAPRLLFRCRPASRGRNFSMNSLAATPSAAGFAAACECKAERRFPRSAFGSEERWFAGRGTRTANRHCKFPFVEAAVYGPPTSRGASKDRFGYSAARLDRNQDHGFARGTPPITNPLVLVISHLGEARQH